MTDLVSLWRHDTIGFRRATMKDVIERVAEKHRVTVEDIKGPSTRRRDIVPARQEFFYEAHLIGRSYPQMATFCGERHHTTAMAGKRRHELHLIAAGEINGRLDEAE